MELRGIFMIIMMTSKLMRKRKVINENAVIIFALLQMQKNKENKHFDIFGCGHNNTCGGQSLKNNERQKNIYRSTVNP